MIALAVLFCFIEGIREYKTFLLNKEAGFDTVPYRTQSKIENALLFLIFAYIALGVWGIPLLSAIRWIILDGVLNTKRDLGFFYVGRTSKIDQIIHKTAPFSASLWSALVKVLSLGLGIVIYLL